MNKRNFSIISRVLASFNRNTKTRFNFGFKIKFTRRFENLYNNYIKMLKIDFNVNFKFKSLRLYKTIL